MRSFLPGNGSRNAGSGPTVFALLRGCRRNQQRTEIIISFPKKPQSEEDASSCTLFQEVFVCKAVSEGVAFIFTPHSGEGGR